MSGSSPRADMFVDAEHDPREGGPTRQDERATLVEYLRCQRLTLELKCSGQDAPAHFRTATATATDRDGDFDGAVPDPDVVDQAWQVWRDEVAFTNQFVATAPGLDVTDDPWQGPISLREVLVHMIEEYARHNGHAGLVRERIDGRLGQ